MTRFADALERQLAAVDGMKLFLREYYADALPKAEDLTAAELRTTVAHMRAQVALLSRATPMYWTKRTSEVVVEAGRSLELADYVALRDMVPFDHGWLWFEEPWLEVETTDIQRHAVRTPVQALSWAWVRFDETPGVESLLVSSFHSVEGGYMSPAVWGYIDQDSPLDKAGQATEDPVALASPTFKAELDAIVRFVTAAGVFLRQRIISSVSTPVDRAARRRLERERPEVKPLVEVIHLRARDSEGREHGPREGEVEWSCRWLVAGHWRKQWYPSLGRHMPKFIEPYTKGPEEAPFRPRRAALYAVTR